MESTTLPSLGAQAACVLSVLSNPLKDECSATGIDQVQSDHITTGVSSDLAHKCRQYLLDLKVRRETLPADERDLIEEPDSLTEKGLCRKGKSYGCTENHFCWKVCDPQKGTWCWLAANNGDGPWTYCSKDPDCLKAIGKHHDCALKGPKCRERDCGCKCW